MELRQLRIFVTVAETLNFSEAAKQLFITQSTLSQTIRQLEYELGVTLFDRNSHEVTITEAGRELLPFARNTIYHADSCKARMDDLGNMRCGVLNIGVTHSFSRVTADIVTEFVRLYPNIKLNIHYRTMNELMDLLLHHKVDFVLSYKPMNTPPQIESTPLFVDKLAVIVRKEHSLAARKSVTLADVEKYPMALPSRGLQARMVLDQLLAGSGMTLNTRIETNLVTPLLRLVRKGRLLTILSCSAVQTHPDLCAVPIDDADNMMQGSVHTLKGTYQKVAAKKFLDLLRDNMYLYRNDFD